jgi:hypothetical protein
MIVPLAPVIDWLWLCPGPGVGELGLILLIIRGLSEYTLADVAEAWKPTSGPEPAQPRHVYVS